MTFEILEANFVKAEVAMLVRRLTSWLEERVTEMLNESE